MLWCYYMCYIVDCLNHSETLQLDWRTPTERMYGHTIHFSMSRFHIWQPIWHYEPIAKFPKSNLLPGWFTSIVWNCGDAFTYVIWKTSRRKWEDGLELVHNIVHIGDGLQYSTTKRYEFRGNKPKVDLSLYDKESIFTPTRTTNKKMVSKAIVLKEGTKRQKVLTLIESHLAMNIIQRRQGKEMKIQLLHLTKNLKFYI